MSRENFYGWFRPRDVNFNALQSHISDAVERNLEERFSDGILPGSGGGSWGGFEISVNSGANTVSVGIGKAYSSGKLIEISDPNEVYDATNPSKEDTQTPPVPTPESTGCKDIPLENGGANDTYVVITYLETVDTTAPNEYLPGHHHEYPRHLDGYQIQVTDDLGTAQGWVAGGSIFLCLITATDDVVLPSARGLYRIYSTSSDLRVVDGGRLHTHGGSFMTIQVYKTDAAVDAKVRIETSGPTFVEFDVTPTAINTWERKTISLDGFQGQAIRVWLCSRGAPAGSGAAYWDELVISFEGENYYENLLGENYSFELFSVQGTSPTSGDPDGTPGTVEDFVLDNIGGTNGWMGISVVPFYGKYSLVTMSRYDDLSIYGCARFDAWFNVPDSSISVPHSVESVAARQDDDNQDGTGEDGHVSGTGPNLWTSLFYHLKHFWKRFKEHSHTTDPESITETALKKGLDIVPPASTGGVLERVSLVNRLRNSSFETAKYAAGSDGLALGWETIGAAGTRPDTQLVLDSIHGQYSQSLECQTGEGMKQVIPGMFDGVYEPNVYILSAYVKPVNAIAAGEKLELKAGTAVVATVDNTVAPTPGVWVRVAAYFAAVPDISGNVEISAVYTGANILRIDAIQVVRGPYDVGYAPQDDFAPPLGAIILWEGNQCPAGYDEVVELQGRFPVGVGTNAPYTFAERTQYGAWGHGHATAGGIQNTDIAHTHSVAFDTWTAHATNSTWTGHDASGGGWVNADPRQQAHGSHYHHWIGATGPMSASNPHTHGHTISATSTDVIPPSYAVRFCRRV